MTNTHDWQGRAVELRDFNVEDLESVGAAFAEKQARGLWLVLSLSAYYVDDGTRVFENPEAVGKTPARLARALTDMALAAMAANGMADTKDDDAPLA